MRCQLTDHDPPQARHRFLDAFAVAQRILREGQQHPARVAELNRPPVAAEELEPELLFKVADVEADRGLAEVQTPCGDGEVLSERGFDKDVEFVKVDQDEASVKWRTGVRKENCRYNNSHQ